LAIALLTLVPGCTDDPDIPEGPNMLPLVEIYDEPPGTLDAQNVEEVAMLAAEQLAKVAELGDLDFVVETLQDVTETVDDFSEEGGDDDTGGQVPVNGVARFQTICPGWVPGEKVDQEANGALNITLPFRDSRYLTVIFGSFARCRFRVVNRQEQVTPIRVELNSAIAGYIGPGIKLDLSNLQSVLFQLEGTGNFDDEEPVDIELDFRVFTAGKVETRVPAQGGDVIPFVEEGVARVGIRAANGTFCCEFEERICIQTEATSCEGVTSGDRALTW
jgi:hypothetical protein